MKRQDCQHTGRRYAFTLLELLIVIGIVAIVAAAILVPKITSDSVPSTSVYCMNNLKQITIGYLMWHGDHGDAFPWEVSVAGGGTSDYAEAGQALPQFQILSNYLENTRVFTCPADKERKSVGTHTELTAENLSYFLSLRMGTNPIVSILAGDRNLTVDGQPVQTGLLRVSSTNKISWTTAIHGRERRTPLGFLGFIDGHSQATSDNLQQFLQRSGVTTTRLLIP